MAPFLQHALWNANGLHQHSEELKTFLSLLNTDIMLISETHFTDKSYLRLPNYTGYHSNHPAGTARGGSAIIIKHSIKHHQLNNHSEDFLQATSVSVEDYTGPLTVSAVYLPPKLTVKHGQLAAFYNTLGHRFIAGGDYNAKHTAWGSRLISPRGREVLKTMKQVNLNNISTGEPTYWPSNCNKLSDLLDFCVTKGISRDSALPRSCFDLYFDHSPVLITLNLSALNQAPPPRLFNSKTNWRYFRLLISRNLTLHVPLKTDSQIEDITQLAGWNATKKTTYTPSSYTCPIFIKQKTRWKKKTLERMATYPDTIKQKITQQSNARRQTTPT
jgi:endonuclease/exonuclease/phosphatase family metal-dependent hydrolase